MIVSDLARLPMDIAMRATVDPDGEISWPIDIARGRPRRVGGRRLREEALRALVSVDRSEFGEWILITSDFLGVAAVAGPAAAVRA